MLTDEERVSCKHHLGYPNANAIQTFVLGVPQALESLFIVEGAMNAIAPGAEERCRRTLRRLDRLEEQIEENSDALVLTKADEVEFREDEFEKIMQRYRYWVGELCNLLGVPGPNPHDARYSQWNGGGGVNVAVAHG
jgi:hypothetical protein